MSVGVAGPNMFQQNESKSTVEEIDEITHPLVPVS